MSQGKSAVTLKLPDDISDKQMHEAEVYAALYALGGYTYNNVIHEVPDEQCNAAKDNKLETDTYGEDKEGIHEMDRVHPWRISTGSLELPPRKPYNMAVRGASQSSTPPDHATLCQGSEWS